jgi:hypothetical protein
MVEVKAGWKGHPYHAGQPGRIQQELHCSNPSCAILRSTRPNENEYQEHEGRPSCSYGLDPHLEARSSALYAPSKIHRCGTG